MFSFLSLLLGLSKGNARGINSASFSLFFVLFCFVLFCFVFFCVQSRNACVKSKRMRKK